MCILSEGAIVYNVFVWMSTDIESRFCYTGNKEAMVQEDCKEGSDLFESEAPRE